PQAIEDSERRLNPLTHETETPGVHARTSTGPAATCSSASAQGYGRVWARGIHSLYTLNVRPRLHHAAHASAPAAPDLGAPPQRKSRSGVRTLQRTQGLLAVGRAVWGQLRGRRRAHRSKRATAPAMARQIGLPCN